ncbi:hypothetical protein PALB_7520 [Pseudoalteromonas luteoviolacea B = ATCC 29581]|nr:hypothetical protein PALB_7520 [Pseudoalteromonas luteoviolacea B = ATCC 29581]
MQGKAYLCLDNFYKSINSKKKHQITAYPKSQGASQDLQSMTCLNTCKFLLMMRV